MVIVGSHNSITGESPCNLLAALFPCFCKCQELPLEKQLEQGVQCLDIRVWRDSEGNWQYGHGMAAYSIKGVIPTPAVLMARCLAAYSKISTDGQPLHVRLILEHPRNNGREEFIKMCKDLEKQFPGIVFFGGRDKHTWEKLYDFKNDPVVHEYHASVSGTGLLRAMPKLFHKLFGSGYELQEGINLIDFIGDGK